MPEQQYTISKPAQDLVSIIRDQVSQGTHVVGRDEPRVKIHEMVGRLAYVYEKIRNAIDYQEEHLIRKNSIARMLKRRILSRERGTVIAEPLIRELIRAGYLQNDYFPEVRIADIERIVDKYVQLINHTTPYHGFQEKNRLFNWIISVASFEIEEYLSPSIKDDALVEAMYKVLRQNLDLRMEIPNPEDQDIQVYIAMHRALIKSDTAILRYHLIHYYSPGWRYCTPEEIPAFAAALPGLVQKIDQQITSPLGDRLSRYLKRFAPYFTILKDVILQDPASAAAVLANPQRLAAAVQDACAKRYGEITRRLSRGVIRSIIYIFLTKTILAFLLELPYERIFLHQIRYMPLAINVAFHPLLMFLIATSIRVPAAQNTQRILQGIGEIVYDPAEKELLKRREEQFRTSRVLNAIFTLLYLVAYVITFGLIIWMLHALHFSLVSGFLFMFFLSVISFFGLRLRHNATELVVLSRKDNLFMVIFDFLTTPILRAGSFIARKTSQVNVFLFIMDFIIEAPFKLLVETVEEWVAFQRKKRDEII